MPLDIIVCLKQVPNPDLQFQVNADGTDIRREGLNFRVNGSDEYALEEAVRLKERHGGKVVAVTAGPKRTEQMLREALAKGADEAVRVTVDDEAAYDAAATARTLAAAIEPIPHDLILTGVQSDDYIDSVVGGYVAGVLGVPHASVVTRIELDGTTLTVNRELEGGDEEVVSLSLPALLTIQYGINTPRYAPLPAIMKAARQPIREVSPPPATADYTFSVRAMSPPPAKGRAEMFTGPVGDQAKQLVRLLREKGFFRG